MAVERCPSCDAKYDVSALEATQEFACRRCGKPVIVDAGAAARRGRWRPALLATGALMVLSLFIYANPGFGSKAAKWPWQHFVESSSLSRKADLLLWVLVGVLAIVFGSGRGGRHRMAWLAAPLILLAARCYGAGAAFTAVRSNEPTLGWFAAVACLGAAGAVLAVRAPQGRAAARTLAWIGALGMVSAYAVTFGPTGHSLIWHYARDYARIWYSLFHGGESEPVTVAALWKQWWGRLLPMALQVVAAVLALAAAALPACRRGALARILGWSIVVLLALRWIEPLVGTFYYEREVLFAGGISSWAQLVGRTVFDAGLGLWLAASFSLAALVREYGRAEPADGPIDHSTGAPEDPAGAPIEGGA